jgi:molybdenum cofactor cytidylyltransferase
MISGVLLAAGESRRMGRFKQLLPLAGKTFVEHCVDNLLASEIDEVIVVTGHRDREVQDVLRDRPVRFAFNADYMSGLSSSIKRGLEAIGESARSMLIALADQPLINPAIINQVVEKYRADGPLIVVPTYGGRNGHPIILDLRLREEILLMDPAVGLRQVVHAHADETARVEVASETVLLDCDLPEDYERMSKRV